MNPNELRKLADRIRYANCDAIAEAVKYLRDCADAMESSPVAWAATDETGKTVEALGMNGARRFSDPLYLRAQVQSLRIPEPMAEVDLWRTWASKTGLANGLRAIEAETLRRVKEANG